MKWHDHGRSADGSIQEYNIHYCIIIIRTKKYGGKKLYEQ